MHEDALQSFCPAFGLLPDIATFVSPHCENIAALPAHHWIRRAPSTDVAAIHDPEFAVNIWGRIQKELDRPVVVSRDSAGRRVLKVLGCFLLLEQANKCWRFYEWKYESIGIVKVVEASTGDVVAQSPPWRWQWLRSLAHPIALEYTHWRWARRYPTSPATAKLYSERLLQILETKLRPDGVRATLTKYLALDVWALKIASRFLRPHNRPQRALLADYNCVLARRTTFAKLESDAPHLIGIYGALCRARGFPRTGEPLQRLREYLVANRISPQTWIAILNAPARFWLIANRYYTGATDGQVLDLIRCIDLLGFDRAPTTWLVDTLLAPHGGPGSRYPNYASELCKGEAVWRHIVRLLTDIEKPTEVQSLDLKRVVDWAGQTGQNQLTRAQRQAGWRWLVGKSLKWEKQQKAELESSGKTWWVPAKEFAVAGHEFRFLTNPLEVWEEGQAMRHCAYILVRGCETGVCLVVSIRRSGERVATLELRRTGEKWWVHQLAGKANRPCTGAVWSAISLLLVLLHAGTDPSLY